MKPIKSTLAILAMLSVAGPLSADETLQVRNCTWCHGSSAQGFMRAPRLAGQRDQYIENQLLSFQQHTRDNPRSQQYMWAASANLSPETAHDLAAYFSTVPPKAANDGDATLAPAGRTIYEEGNRRIQCRRLRCLSWPECGRGAGNPPPGRALLFLFEGKTRAVGRGFHAAAGPMPQIASTLSPEQIDAARLILELCRVRFPGMIVRGFLANADNRLRQKLHRIPPLF